MKIFIILLCTVLSTVCKAQIVNIPNATFKAILVYSTPQNLRAKDLSGNYFAIDANGDREIQVSEAEQVSYIEVSESLGSGIYTLEGINQFPNLAYFSCTNASLYDVNINGLKHLELINIIYSGIDVVNFYDLPSLKTLSIWYNNLTELDVSNLPSLEILNCYHNDLTNLDLSMLTKLKMLACRNNQLESINMKNGKTQIIQDGIDQGYVGYPTLRFICVDDLELAYIQEIISAIQGGDSVVINDYCSFTPGGEYFSIQGNIKFDYNTNGCDTSDINFPNLNFSITDSINSGTFISNQSGEYIFPVQAGSHTITPFSENPTYYNISPASFVAKFPTSTSPLVQNICVTANGVHNDLEVFILPLNSAIPGFDARYSIVYKNKGTNSQSGFINLIFNDSTLDFISANPVIQSQSANSLSWNFTNLLPFESREITLKFNVNTPVETIPVNIGDTLNYSSSITGLTDETPNDNTASLNQIVVNSFDPNDKTCLEGTTISPATIGKYIHYMIRFENSGTANAQNIVVKDIIDTTKFDINTLIPINGGHSFETKISSRDKVEFIFQNINLPFDDENNDGYIAFKIKTKSTLVTGNTFSNSASIYFDYNAPIVTNNYVTTIQQTLGINEDESNNINSIYPNPIKDVLTFNSQKEITRIEVFDLSGRILFSYSVNQNNVNLSELKTGYYILKFHFKNGTSNARIVKD